MSLNITSHTPTFYSILSLVIGLLSFGLGLFVLSKNSKEPVNRTYFLFCLGIAAWLIPNSISSSKLFPSEITILCSKIVYTGVAFMPTFALHFAIEYLGPYANTKARQQLKLAYAGTIFFLVLLWTTNKFITGVYEYSWGYYPKGGMIHYFHTAFVLWTAAYIIRLFWIGMKSVESSLGRVKKYYEFKFLFLAFLFVTLASSDFLHNWGFDFFPIGCIFVALFITITTYAIFKHELLGISVVIKASLVYSVLISIITSIYFSIVYIVGSFLGGLTKSHSLPIVLFTLAVITLLFKPLEQKTQKIIDRWVFKKPRDVIEKENELLHQQVQKQDHMKAVATLAAGMAHEIKNPLTSIKTFAEYLPERYEDPEFRDKFKRIVVDEVDRVNNIVKQLLEFAKPREPELKLFSVNAILDETIELLNSNLLSHEIRVVKNYAQDQNISADKAQLKQAFLNLFLNSIQAMPHGGTLSVSTSLTTDYPASPAGGRLLTTITDTGEGIPEADLKRVFDPFFTTREDGTGLGLSIVHGIITKHGGKLEIKSKAGLGTTVSVILKG